MCVPSDWAQSMFDADPLCSLPKLNSGDVTWQLRKVQSRRGTKSTWYKVDARKAVEVFFWRVDHCSSALWNNYDNPEHQLEEN